jgi:hypothetical protein
MIIALRVGKTEVNSTQYGFPIFQFRISQDKIEMNAFSFNCITWTSPKFIKYERNRWVNFFGFTSKLYQAERNDMVENIWVYEWDKKSHPSHRKA